MTIPTHGLKGNFSAIKTSTNSPLPLKKSTFLPLNILCYGQDDWRYDVVSVNGQSAADSQMTSQHQAYIKPSCSNFHHISLTKEHQSYRGKNTLLLNITKPFYSPWRDRKLEVSWWFYGMIKRERLHRIGQSWLNTFWVLFWSLNC